MHFGNYYSCLFSQLKDKENIPFDKLKGQKNYYDNYTIANARNKWLSWFNFIGTFQNIYPSVEQKR